MKRKQLFTEKSLKDYYERNSVSTLSKSQKKEWIGGRFKCRIGFFKDNIFLGEYPCLEGSNDQIRTAIATFHGIMEYDKYILDKGRLTGFYKDGRTYKARSRHENNVNSHLFERLIPTPEEYAEIFDGPTDENGGVNTPEKFKEIEVTPDML